MVATERVLEYASLSPVEAVSLDMPPAREARVAVAAPAAPPPPPAAVEAGGVALEGAAPPPPGWPYRGAIVLSGLKLRYSEGAPAVLKGVSFSVPAGARCGVVGRTGAGKSSLLASLLRLTEPTGGVGGAPAAAIDGVDISAVPLTLLRRSIAFIPQDPHLVAGSIKANLDPFSWHTEAVS
jgi:ABC-type multidrug transport system fused ATPase/permease subunit